MSMSTIPPEANPWQLARKDEYDAGGLYAFCIAGTVICGITVILRLWSRKLQKMQWQSDDYTLIAAMVRKHSSVPGTPAVQPNRVYLC